MPRSILMLFLMLALAGNSRAATLTLNVAARGGSLKKAGLGDLFGITTNSALGPWRYYMTNSFLFVSEHQTRIGEGLNVPCSTSAVGPLLRGTKIKMMCRFGDLCYGWAPYKWPGLNPSWLGAGAANSWLTQVTNACNDIKNNYQDVVHSIAIFNEPEDELVDTNFFNDPNIVGGTQQQRMNYVWMQTFKSIRSMLPTVKIMGPNYEDFTPQYHSGDLAMMSNFLANAIATGTVPDIIGWHILNYNPINPGIIGTSLNTYYRPLEALLNVPGRPLPVAIEEFGANNSAFQGIPGQMIPFWAEFERDGIDFGSMGAYGNGGDLGNTMRYTMWDANPSPNAGWFMMNWYLQMQGQYIPVTKPGNGLDAVASWDSTSQVLTILLGGADGNATVQVNGLGALGLGNTVRVRLDLANWTTNSNVAVTGAVVGGDPQTGGYNLYDNNFTLDGSGNLAIPVNAVEGLYNGYRISITTSNAPDAYPTKYEAEAATVNHSILYSTAQASGGKYVGGIDYADSYVTFHVTAPSNGLYNMLIRYADSAAYGAASQYLTVNGQSQGVVNYSTTAGWAGTELRTTTRLVSLVRGLNDIRLAHATNYAELDFIDVRPSTHRYEAELATNNCTLKPFNTCYLDDCVVGINATTNFVEYAVFAPVAGSYVITSAYANGIAGTASDAVTVNGVSAGNLNCFYTGGWFGGGWMSGSNPALTRQFSSLTVSLNAGLNLVRLYKNTNFTEQDYLTVAPVSVGPAAAYAFEGNVLDSSGNGNDGTVNGTPTYINGKIGRAAQFNGVNAWVSAPISIGSMDFSIAMWIRTTDMTGTSTDQWYADHGLVDGEMPNVVNDFGTAIGGGYFKFGIGNPDTTLTSSTLISDGIWHHVAATWNAGSGAMQIYVDGALNVSGTGPGGPRTAVANGLHIGNSHSGGKYFIGALDDVQLYNRVLSSSEVGAMAATAIPAVPTGLAIVGGNGQVTLNWTPSVGATNYVIKRSTTSGTETAVANCPGPGFTDIGLASGTTYYYVVSAQNAAGASANSVEVSAATLAFPPLQLTSAFTGGSQLAMAWPLWASNYSVYATTNLAAPNWQEVTNVPQVGNGMFYLSLPTTNLARQFFRLSYP